MNAIVEVARTWIGTRYVHQASLRGSGTDCLGLIRGVWRQVYGVEPESVPAYSRDWAEPQGIEVLLESAGRHLKPVPRDRVFRPGELLLFRMRDVSIAKHLGIVGEGGDRPSFIHAYSGHGVVETSLSQPWARRVAARFEFPNVHDEEN